VRALVRAHQLEIASRRRIDDEKAAGALLARRAQERRLPNLGDLDVSEQPCERRKLWPRELAEGVKSCDAEPLLQSTLAAE
jgi:hypothetical protein